MSIVYFSMPKGLALMAWELLQILSILNQILNLFVDNDKIDIIMMKDYINQLEERLNVLEEKLKG